MSGEVECSVCHAKVAVPAAVSKAYHTHRTTVSSRQRALNVLLVSGDCVLAGLQVILASFSTFSSVWSVCRCCVTIEPLLLLLSWGLNH
jgi:hypothetical protein